MNKIGFMQGRLSPLVNNQIQGFPFDNWFNEFKSAELLGLACMEWTLDYPKLRSNPLLLKSSENQILSLCKTHKITIPSITLDCCMQRPFWKIKNKSIYKDLLEDLKLIINSACRIGVKILVIPLVDNGSINQKLEFDILKNTIFSLNDLLIKKNIKIAFESDYQPLKLRNFINQFDKDTVGINYDIGNSASLGYNIDDEFNEYGERIINIHVKDRLLNGGTVRLGEGNADFPKITKILKNMNFKGNFILQTARSKTNKHYEELEKNINFIKKFIYPFNF